MATIDIKITATMAQFSTFADELGYMTMVIEEIDSEPIPNPETKQAFLERKMKEIVVQELFRRKAMEVDRQVREEKIAEKEVLRTGIESAVSVTSKA